MYAWMYVCMYGWMDVWMDVWMYGCMDAWMYKCMDVRMDGCIWGFTAAIHLCEQTQMRNLIVIGGIYNSGLSLTQPW